MCKAARVARLTGIAADARGAAPFTQRRMRTSILLTALLLAACSDKATRGERLGETEGVASTPAPPPSPYAAKARQRAAEDRAVAAGATASAPTSASIALASAPAQAPGPAASPEGPQPSVAPSMLIRTGEAWVEVRELDAAVEQVRRLAASVGGYIGNTQVAGGRDEVRTATLEVKVPAQSFDRAISGLTGLGKVERVSVAAQDVGEEFTDVTTRATNARRLEERLLDLLARRTGRLEDVLAVERELARVREEIERMEGRLRYLRTRAAVSTLTITVHEPRPVVGGPGHHPIVEAFRDAWRNFVGFLAGLIASLGVLIPVAAIVAGLVWLARRMGWFRRPPPAGREPGAGSRVE